MWTYNWIKKFIIGTVYRSSGKNSDELESFLLNFEFLLQDISNCNPPLLNTITLAVIMQEIWNGGVKISLKNLTSNNHNYLWAQIINLLALLTLIWFSQISQTLLPIHRMHLSLPANCQNQITFAMASLRVAYPLALNVISGIMQKVVLME